MVIGVVGTGAWGKKVIAAIKALGFGCVPCNLHGEFDGKPVCRDYGELSKLVDMVFIAAHPSVNREIAGYFLSNRIPTIVEKPVSFSAREVRELVGISNRSQTSFIVDYTYLFNHGVTALFRGENTLSGLNITMENEGPHRDYSALWDYGSHAIAVAVNYCGAPHGISLACSGRPKMTRFEIALECDKRRRVDIIIDANADKRRVSFKTAWKHRDFYCGESFVDEHQHNPLSVLIARAASKHLRGEYLTNGPLAVEVTDLLERLDAMAKAQP